MGPLSTVAHVLAATGHTSPPNTANLFGHSMSTPHATPGPHMTGSTSFFGPPSGAAATAAAIRPGTPDTHNRTPFSACGLDQGDPQDISMSEPPPDHPFPGQPSHLMTAPGASSEGYDPTIAVAASLDSSLGSGFIPAYFDTQGTGMPDLPGWQWSGWPQWALSDPQWVLQRPQQPAQRPLLGQQLRAWPLGSA